MREAIRLANESVERGGGPFGAIIVKDGEVIAGSSNSVTIDNDPTAHAEVNTIRQACRKLGTFDLTGATIYTSCEPCPMCLGAIYWHVSVGSSMATTERMPEILTLLTTSSMRNWIVRLMNVPCPLFLFCVMKPLFLFECGWQKKIKRSIKPQNSIENCRI